MDLMPYEIPQNLRYAEKIAFGMTFQQLGFVGFFGILAGITLFKLAWPLEARVVLALVLAGFGGGFAFLNLGTTLRQLAQYYLKPRRQGYFNKTTERAVGIHKIDNYCVYLSQMDVRAILQVYPINFHILGKQEQSAVLSAYQEFLNSLGFSVQVVMRTVDVDLEEYLRDLEQRALATNMDSAKEIDGFRQHLAAYFRENKVQNRVFYLVIPHRLSAKDPHTGLEELDAKVDLCREKLVACGLQTERLNDAKLISLFASYFDCFLEKNQEYTSAMTTLEVAA